MTGTGGAPASGTSMEDYNRRLLAQIEGRILQGLASSMQDAAYCVIRNASTGVLAVLASTTTDQDPCRAFGPASFAQCLDYVNATVVTRMAEEPEPPPERNRNDLERNAR